MSHFKGGAVGETPPSRPGTVATSEGMVCGFAARRQRGRLQTDRIGQPKPRLTAAVCKSWTQSSKPGTEVLEQVLVHQEARPMRTTPKWFWSCRINPKRVYKPNQQSREFGHGNELRELSHFLFPKHFQKGSSSQPCRRWPCPGQRCS